MTEIIAVGAREILDSRGNPTVEVDVTLDRGTRVGRGWLVRPAAQVTNYGINLRITKGIKGRHHSARTPLPNRNPQKLVIDAVQKGRQ